MAKVKALTGLLGIIYVLSVIPASGQTNRKWSMQAGLGGLKMIQNDYHGGLNYVSEDQGNCYYLKGGYYLQSGLVLIGGLTLEQQGLFTNYSNGIGLKKVNLFGLEIGGKYYFFPCKWIVQPHIGASLFLNILNLGHQQGENHVVAEEGYSGSHGVLTYDVQCPALSFAPCIGVDIHLLGSLSLCIDYDVRFGLWGHNKSELRFTDGPIVGHVVGIDERNLRSCISVGMKLDIPVKPISEMDRNNLLWLIYSLISPNTCK
jgi:hypothetical protein